MDTILILKNDDGYPWILNASNLLYCLPGPQGSGGYRLVFNGHRLELSISWKEFDRLQQALEELERKPLQIPKVVPVPPFDNL